MSDTGQHADVCTVCNNLFSHHTRYKDLYNINYMCYNVIITLFMLLLKICKKNKSAETKILIKGIYNRWFSNKKLKLSNSEKSIVSQVVSDIAILKLFSSN